jgi:menaquinone-dependent protoporphyrinogen oxidase
MPNRIGLYFTSRHGQTRAIAGHIGQRLATYGWDVTITDLDGDPRARPGLHEFDTVLIGAPLYIRRYPPSVVRFLRAHRVGLRRHPSTGFFSVSLTAALGTREAYLESLGPLRELLSDIDWSPDWIASFGGALTYRQYDRLTRWVLRRIAVHYRYSTDTSRDHDLTSWSEVSRFADDLANKAGDSPFRSRALSLPSRSLDRVMPRFEERVTVRTTVDGTPEEIGRAVESVAPSTAGTGYVPIAHAEPHEVAGAFVGHFAKGEFGIDRVRDEAAFAAFNEPGHSKVVTDVWYDDTREGGTIVRAESRIHTPGADAGDWLGWHSLVLSRGLRLYMRRMLRTIRRTVGAHHDAPTR